MVCCGKILEDRVSVANSVRPQIPVLRQGVLLVFEDEVARVEGGEFDDDRAGVAFLSRDDKCMVDGEWRGVEVGREITCSASSHDNRCYDLIEHDLVYLGLRSVMSHWEAKDPDGICPGGLVDLVDLLGQLEDCLVPLDDLQLGSR
jgi:hypothetical protein